MKVHALRRNHPVRAAARAIGRDVRFECLERRRLLDCSGFPAPLPCEVQDFDAEAIVSFTGWAGNGRNRDAAGGTDFGFSATGNASGSPGEIGGLFSEYARPAAFYADMTIGGPLTLDDAFKATGKLRVRNVANASGNIEIGWFDLIDGPSQPQGIGIILVAPASASGPFAAFPFIRNGSGFTRNQSSLVPVAQNASLDFAIEFDPQGDGRLTITIAGNSLALDLDNNTSRPDTEFDAFGLGTSPELTVTRPDHQAEFFLDSLRYTSPAASAVVALDDGYSTPEGTSLTVDAPGVLANDVAFDGNELIAVLDAENVVHGTLDLAEDGSFLYEPETGFNGLDHFTYRANDGTNQSEPATVTLVVGTVPPLAADDGYKVAESGTLSVSAPGVLANDTSYNGSPLHAELVAEPNHGSLNLSADGSFTYVPNVNFSGSDSFSYRAISDAGESIVATVSIAVTSTDELPIEVQAFDSDESATAAGWVGNGRNRDAAGGTDFGFSPTGNAAGLPGEAGGIFSEYVRPGAFYTDMTIGGPLTLDDAFHATGKLRVRNIANASGHIEIGWFDLIDGPTQPQGIGIFLVAPSTANGPFAAFPFIRNGSGFTRNQQTNVPVPQNSALDFSIDFDPEGNGRLRITIGGNSMELHLSENTSRPDTEFDAFGVGTSPELTVTQPSHLAELYLDSLRYTSPGAGTVLARDDDYLILRGDALSVEAPGVLANDVDYSGHALSVQLVSEPLFGSVNLASDGSFDYVADEGVHELDSFSYIARSAHRESNVATVSVRRVTSPVVEVGEHALRGNTPGQVVEIFVSGGQPIAGVNVFAQVGDGGPELVTLGLPAGTDGPAITAIDVKSATVFAGVPDAPFVELLLPQIATASLAISEPGGAVPAEGLLLTLTVDTTGFFSGEWDLLLSDVLPGFGGGPFDTDFGGEPAYIINGQLRVVPATIAARKLFYDGSEFDSTDDDAIAMDKQPLLPEQTATFANYSSYVGGINGLMVDIVDPLGAPSLADFVFYVGRSNNTATWSPAPAPSAFEIRPGEGTDGADRIVVRWDDGAITNAWLMVRVKGNTNTGLVADDVFYFGNAIGESGDSSANALVNATDVIGTRDNPHGPFNPAAIDDRFDFNRDRLVNATDLVIARDHATSPISALPLIAPNGAIPSESVLGGAARRSMKPAVDAVDALFGQSSKHERNPTQLDSGRRHAIAVEFQSRAAQRDSVPFTRSAANEEHRLDDGSVRVPLASHSRREVLRAANDLVFTDLGTDNGFARIKRSDVLT